MNLMKLHISLTILILLICMAFPAISCSKAKSPIEPMSNADENPIFGTQIENNRSVIGIWVAVIDPESKTFVIEPTDRIGEYHFPLNNLYPNVVKIMGYGFTSHFWADIRLSHPFPGSGIDGFDPRVIAVLPANPDVNMEYPTLQVLMNHSAVLHPDGYTKLFDKTNLAGNTNPFLAYFKNQINRVWSSTGVTQDTRRWELNLMGFGGPVTFYLVVDVSTNYPNPPQPNIDNALEPIQIDAEIHSAMSPTGGNASVQVTILDWHDLLSIGPVLVEAPDLFDGTVELLYSGPGAHQNEYTYGNAIWNQKNAPQGEYNLLVAASDVNTGIAMYNEFKVIVQEHNAFNLIELTPQQLNFAPQDIFVDGNYAYIAARQSGLRIIKLW